MIIIVLKLILKKGNQEKEKNGVKTRMIKKLKNVVNVWDVTGQKIVVVVKFVQERIDTVLQKIKKDASKEYV